MQANAPENLFSDVFPEQAMSKEPGKGTGFFNVLKSAVSAAFGVQSSKNRERDFQHGKPIHFIVAGILLTLTFLFLVGLFVKVMISTSA